MSGIGLKPCPFCGSRDVSADQPGGLEWWVRCAECGAATDIFDAEAEAAGSWNRRAAGGEHAAMLAARSAEPIRCPKCGWKAGEA